MIVGSVLCIEASSLEIPNADLTLFEERHTMLELRREADGYDEGGKE